MDNHKEQLETLQEIRSLMERSTRFSSLSALTGIVAGCAALAGIYAAYTHLGIAPDEPGYYKLLITETGELNNSNVKFLFADLLIVFIFSMIVSGYLTRRKAQQDNRVFWDGASKRLIINMSVPMITGFIFCIALFYSRQLEFIAPISLVFYGLALINASKYTISDIRWLGFAQLITGLIAAFFLEYGLLFWALGFGIIHIIYGLTMYLKYER